jgi:hypothetical protein
VSLVNLVPIFLPKTNGKIKTLILKRNQRHLLKLFEYNELFILTKKLLQGTCYNVQGITMTAFAFKDKLKDR